MSVFMDLNLTFTEDKNVLRGLIETAAHLGFSTVAINYVFDPSAKNKQIPTPRPVSELLEELPIVQGRSRPIRVLNRLTVVMSHAGHYRPSSPEYRRYDLLAAQPTHEKVFHAACMTYDVDIICIPVMEKLPFFFKRAPICGAVDRGLVFEVAYTAAIRDATMRRYTIANAISLVESCKGKNVMVSSAAERPLDLRGPYDITNLCMLFGLVDRDAKEAVSSTCRSVLLHAETRKTTSGIIYTKKKAEQEAPQEPSACEGPAAKRSKPAEGEDQEEQEVEEQLQPAGRQELEDNV